MIAEPPALLCLLHASFDVPHGGTEHHVRDLLGAVRLPRAVVVVPAADGLHVTEVRDGRLDATTRYRLPLAAAPAYALDRPDVADAVAHVVRAFGIGAAHLHQLSGWPVSIWRTLAALGVPYVVTLQDFLCVCPNSSGFDVASDRLCCLAPADAAVPARAGCLSRQLAPTAVGPDPAALLAAHRAEFGALLGSAERVFFPSEHTCALVGRFHDVRAMASVVEPHGYPTPIRRVPRGNPCGALHVALLGAVASPLKGAREHLRLMERTRNVPLVWHVFGDAERDGWAARVRALELGARVRFHGWYRRETLVDRLAAAAVELFVFLPPWPETFSYTLSEGLTAGLPALVADQGALPERVRAAGAGVVVGDVDEAARTLAWLAARPPELARLRDAALDFRHRSVEEMGDAYRPAYEAMLRNAGTMELDDAALEALRCDDPLPAAAAPDLPLPHYDQAWYAGYRRIAHAVPAPLRRLGRAYMERRWWRSVHTLRFGRGSRHVAAAHGATLVHATFRRATYRMSGAGAHLVLAPLALATARVRLVRFALRSSVPGSRRARLWWTHAAGEPFSDAKSVVVPLATGDERWREYTIAVDQSDRRGHWEDGTTIIALRFAPLDADGVVELATLRLYELARPGA